MCVLAHPDDESLGTGGILAKYSADGVETFVVTATRGERGRFDDKGTRPGPDIVGRTRDAELRAAAHELGVREVIVLDYLDGELDRVDGGEASEKIAGHIRRVRPHVIVTFDPFGAYGHPDHIAISQLTAAAIARAADSHRVSKFYYFVNGERKWAAYQAAFKTLTSTVDGVVRAAMAWPDWAITTRDRRARLLAHRVAGCSVPQDADEHLQERREPHRRRSESNLGHRRVLSRVQPGQRRPRTGNGFIRRVEIDA